MVSPFEDVLLRCSKPKGGFRTQLFDYLDDGASLRPLRAVSKVLYDLVDHRPGRLFRSLYVKAPLTGQSDMDSLEVLAPLCYNLTITIGEDTNDSKRNSGVSSRRLSKRSSQESVETLRTRRAMSRSSWPKKWRDSILSVNTTARASVPPARLPLAMRNADEVARLLWQTIFLRCHQLRSLTLRVHGDTAWPGRTEVEDGLVTLRTALEPPEALDRPDPRVRCYLPKLEEVRIAPVHAMGIIHLRWRGLGAFGHSPSSPPFRSIWQQLSTLELQLHNPFSMNKLTNAQALMFKKILHDSLRSFRATLRCLRFTWLDDDGPSPLLLHLEEGLEDRGPLVWPELKQLWLGGVAFPHRTIQILSELTPNVERLRVLRSTHRDSSLDPSDSAAWMDVLLGKEISSPISWSDNTSSIYSQSTMRLSMLTNGGESRTSRIVPFMLDVSDGWSPIK